MKGSTRKVGSPLGQEALRGEPGSGFSILNQVVLVNLSCLAVLISVFMGRARPLSYQVSIGVVLALLLSALILFALSGILKLKVLRILLIFCLSLASYIHASNIFIRNSSYQNLYGQNLSLVASVRSDAGYNSYGDYEFDVDGARLVQVSEDGSTSYGPKLKGVVKIKTKQALSVHRGNKVFISGKLRSSLGSRIGTISYAEVEVIDSHISRLEDLRLGFFQNIFNALPEPHAALAVGFLVGSRSLVPPKVQEALNRTGLSHIIAVSGYNLTILVMAVSKLGKKRLSKRQRFALSLSLIAVFMLFTGFSPSIVRASLVSFLSLLAAYYGRKVRPLSLILLSAAITAGINPTYLWSDLGWWLSFLAFFGILVLAPILKSALFKSKEPGLLSSIALETFSAQILTAPLIGWAFGVFSVIGLLANVLVLPSAPFIMLFAFLVGAIYFFSKPLAILIATLPKIVLSLDIWIVEKLSTLSWAQLNIGLGFWQMIIIYLAVAIFCLIKGRNLGSGLVVAS